MDNSTYTVRLEHWASLIQSCADSGLTKAEWCRQNNIKTKTYYYWQRRVRKHALMLQGISPDSDMPLTEVGFRGSLTGYSSTAEGLQRFQPDMILRHRTMTIEISNTASDRLLSLIAKVTSYA